MSTAGPDLPPMKEFKSEQYEFNDEQNREFSSLADAMRVTASLMQLGGLAFVVLGALTCVQAAGASVQGESFVAVLGRFGPALGLFAGALVCLCVGFWTGGAADSFRKIADTKNEDVWHLMNAVGSLRSLFGSLRTMVYAALVLSAVALGMIAFGLLNK